MKRKRVAALILACVLTLCFLSGCGQLASMLRDKVQNGIDSSVAGTAPVAPSSGSTANASSAPNTAAAALVWDVAPTFDYDDVILMDSPYGGYNIDAAAYYGLAFFKRAGGSTYGVVDMEGNEILPPEADVYWCGLCGITSVIGHVYYTPDGRRMENIGHGGLEGCSIYIDGVGALSMDHGYIDNGTMYTGWDDNGFLPVATTSPAYSRTASPDTQYNVQTVGKYYLVDAVGRPLQGDTYYRAIVPQNTVSFYMDSWGDTDLLSPPANLLNCVQFADGTWGFIDQTGNVMLDGYECAKPFAYGCAPVQKDGKWGYIDTDGNVVIDFILDKASILFDGAAWAKLDGRWGVLRIQPSIGEENWKSYTGSATSTPAAADNSSANNVLQIDLSAGTIPPDTAINNAPSLTVEADGGLRMRSGPGTNYDKLQVIPKGASLTPLGDIKSIPDWVFVQYSGVYGWVSTEYLS